MKIFSDYAEYYNLLYHDKDYFAESLFISELIGKFSHGNKSDIRILDLACGTGRHTLELSKMGYRVDGSDISKDMIEIAVQNNKRESLHINFFNESFQTASNIPGKYDFVISMFSAIDYLIDYDNISLAFNNIHGLLNDGGIFIFDFWNGIEVLNNYSPVRIKRMCKDDIKIVRTSKTSLDKISHITKVVFNFILEKKGIIIKEFNEEHLIRYFFLQEMKDILKANKFEFIFGCPFMKITSNVSISDWNITYVARKQ